VGCGLVSPVALAHKKKRAFSPENDPKMTKILLNGEETEVLAANVMALIEQIGIDPRKVAVERNLEIVPKSAYVATPIEAGDRFEIVHFVGGGD
jgi:thiamine biosynthesis protein ThiS